MRLIISITLNYYSFKINQKRIMNDGALYVTVI